MNCNIISSSCFPERNLKNNNIYPSFLWDESKFLLNNNNENSRQFPIKNGKKFFFNIDNLILKEEDSSNDNQIKEKETNKKEKTNNIKGINKDYINSNKNINKDDIKSGEKINLFTQKFFTDNNTGLKCSCFKTQCDKYYCECFRSRRYCINCICKNCLNQPPKYSTTDKKDKNNEKINKEKKIFCTCSKSGCKLKYCECFKLGLKCTDFCRCIKCENPKYSKKYNQLYKIANVNSIYIINNELFQEVKGKNNYKKLLNKKKKRRENKIKKNKVTIHNKKDNNLKGSLFDENGNMIFTHTCLSKFENF